MTADRPDLTKAVESMARLQRAVTELVDQTERFVPRNEFEEILSDRATRRQQLILTAVAVGILVATFGWGFYRIANEVRQGTRCMVEQMVEHRLASRTYDRLEAEKLGIPIDEAALPPLPDIHPERLNACDSYEIINGGAK